MEKEVENILINAGWSESRRIDKRFVVDQLVLEGFPALENVVEAMQNLGGLVIKFLNRQNGLKDDDINFFFPSDVSPPGHMKYNVKLKGTLRATEEVYDAIRNHLLQQLSKERALYKVKHF